MRSNRIKNMLWIASEKGAYLATSIVSFIFFAWYLTPAEFGAGILCISIVELLGLVITSYVDDSMVRRNSLEDGYLSSVFWVGLSISVFSALSLIALVALFSDDARFLVAMSVCSLKIPLIFLGRICVAECRRNRDFKFLAKRTFWGKLLGTVVGVLGAYFGLKEFSLIFQVVVVELVSTAMLLFLRGRLYQLPRNFGFFREILFDGFPIMIKYVTADTINRGMVLILGGLSGTAVLGIYGFAYRLVELPKSLVQNGVLSYALPAFSSRVNNPDKLKKFFLNSVEFSSYFLIGVFFILAALSDTIIEYIFSEKWEDSVVLAMWFYIAAGIGFLTFLTAPLVNSLGKNKNIVIGEFFAALICLAALFFTAESYGLLSALIVRVCYTLFVSGVSVYVLAVDAEIRLNEFFGAIYRPVIAGVAVLMVDFLYNLYYLKIGLSSLLFEMSVVSVVYVGCSLLMRPRIYRDIHGFFYDSSN